MDNMASSRVWWFRVLFVIVAMGLMFFRLLPLDTRPQNWAGPDILMALIFAWSAQTRRDPIDLDRTCHLFRRPHFATRTRLAGRACDHCGRLAKA